MIKEKQQRGQLTQKIKDKSKELFGYEITVGQLRLMAYVQYIMTNNQIVESQNVNEEEICILEKWQDEGYVLYDRTTGRINITKKFWNIMSEILYLGYVNINKL